MINQINSVGSSEHPGQLPVNVNASYAHPGKVDVHVDALAVEMYEGKKADEVTRSLEISSYSNATIDIMTYEQAYIIPYGVTALSTTSTRLGVTHKNLIVASRRHAVHSVPRRLLDPRRPLGKVSPSEAEEGLVTYDAVLPDDAQLALSHNYEAANIRQIMSSPSRLESTSLVLAIGLDLFLTRVSPSGTFDVLSENFNKAQLVLTIGGLALAIGLVRPVVRRRQLRGRWYPAQIDTKILHICGVEANCCS